MPWCLLYLLYMGDGGCDRVQFHHEEDDITCDSAETFVGSEVRRLKQSSVSRSLQVYHRDQLWHDAQVYWEF